MRIAIYDYLVVPTNPAGSCHRALISALSHEHEFTVFSTRFDNPCPERVSWVKVPSMRRPLAALFLTFHFASFFRYLGARRSLQEFSLVQSVESNFAFGDVVYCHFCHRWFLRNRWRAVGARGFVGAMRWLDHALHALYEPLALRHAKWIVVPSEGLARELTAEYPFVATKVRVIPNPVELESYAPRPGFDRSGFRAGLGVASGEKLIVFVALGHFELKGLPLLLDALSVLKGAGWKLVVVGGMPDLVDKYSRRASSTGLGEAVQFVGMQNDVRAFLWAADLFALPSSYEVFPLSVLQAAAAACPILVTEIHGVEEFLADGESCLCVAPNSDSVLQGLRRFEALSRESRGDLGRQAQRAVRAYGTDRFASAWRDFYSTVALEASRG
jgi:glycosyltransferase involved in cell wall biosynthesis